MLSLSLSSRRSRRGNSLRRTSLSLSLSLWVVLREGVSFSATSPSLSPEKTPYFVRTAVDDSSQASAIAALVSAFGWKQVVPVYKDSQYGAGAMPSLLVDAIKGAGARVPYRCVLPVKASDDHIAKELYKLVTMEVRVFLVQVSRALAVRLFTRANEADMMTQGFAWITAEGLTRLMGAMEPSVLHDSTQGIVGVRPYVDFKSERLRRFNKRWQRELLIRNGEGPDSADRPSVMGLWAYDTVWALATAAESVGAEDPGYTRAPGTDNSKDLAALGVSATGPMLLKAIRSTDLIHGLSGRFHLVDGQLQAPAFEVVNVNDRTETGEEHRVLDGGVRPRAACEPELQWRELLDLHGSGTFHGSGGRVEVEVEVEVSCDLDPSPISAHSTAVAVVSVSATGTSNVVEARAPLCRGGETCRRRVRKAA